MKSPFGRARAQTPMVKSSPPFVPPWRPFPMPSSSASAPDMLKSVRSMTPTKSTTAKTMTMFWSGRPTLPAMNPTISQAYIDREIEKDPEAGRAEWLGLFREDVSAAFPLEVIEACIVPGRMEIPYSPHVSRYFGFLDPSGGRHDAFTLAIAHQNYESDKIVLDAIRATRSPFDPSEVVKDYSDVLKAYRLSSSSWR